MAGFNQDRPAPDVQISSTPTPFAVICRRHGRVYLTEAEYTRQMMNPDNLWQHPGCDERADFDDETYERSVDPDHD
jgi:hypothetical protein